MGEGRKETKLRRKAGTSSRKCRKLVKRRRLARNNEQFGNKISELKKVHVQPVTMHIVIKLHPEISANINQRESVKRGEERVEVKKSE